ncbi:hypothetical protein COU37_01675 [Candidatus Micrarchaeota archaeon CG10_big_fil_rev_8_21_14_0_10_45_29]|nr:MAG: hypothetical protein COU37_01675 [Candidatus Micrarchaeota archaeon CG10_big_fil_rev_8_21_14_0_10_45_29]
MAEYKGHKFLSSNESEALRLLQCGLGRREGKDVILHPLEAAYVSQTSLLPIMQGKNKMDVKKILIEGEKHLSEKNKKSPAPAKNKKNKPAKNARKGANGEVIAKLPSLQEQYALFKHLRERGRVVRLSPSPPQYWRVHARGVGREQERAQTLIFLLPKNWQASLKSIEVQITAARQLRMEIVLAYVQNNEPNWIKLSKFAFD